MVHPTRRPQLIGNLFFFTKGKKLSPHFSKLKTSIDNGILKELHFEKENTYENAPQIDISTSEFPVAEERTLKGVDVSVVFGSFYF